MTVHGAKGLEAPDRHPARHRQPPGRAQPAADPVARRRPGGLEGRADLAPEAFRAGRGRPPRLVRAESRRLLYVGADPRPVLAHRLRRRHPRPERRELAPRSSPKRCRWSARRPNPAPRRHPGAERTTGPPRRRPRCPRPPRPTHPCPTGPAGPRAWPAAPPRPLSPSASAAFTSSLATARPTSHPRRSRGQGPRHRPPPPAGAPARPTPPPSGRPRRPTAAGHPRPVRPAGGSVGGPRRPGPRRGLRPDSLAEVAIAAPLDALGGPILGRLDRLIVSPDRVLAVDFKSNAVVPPAPEAVPDGILLPDGRLPRARSCPHLPGPPHRDRHPLDPQRAPDGAPRRASCDRTKKPTRNPLTLPGSTTFIPTDSIPFPYRFHIEQIAVNHLPAQTNQNKSSNRRK